MSNVLLSYIKKRLRTGRRDKNDKHFDMLDNTDYEESLCDVVGKDIEDVKRFNYALWKLLKDKGFTDKELDEQLDVTLELDVDQSSDNTEQFCSQCNRKMQKMDSFRSRCIYCGNSIIANPYQFDVEKLKLEDIEE